MVSLNTEPGRPGAVAMLWPDTRQTPFSPTITADAVAFHGVAGLLAPDDGTPMPAIAGVEGQVQVLNLPGDVPGAAFNKFVGVQGRVAGPDELPSQSVVDKPIGVRGAVVFRESDFDTIGATPSIGVQGLAGLTPQFATVTGTAVGVQGAAGFMAVELAGSPTTFGTLVGLQGLAGVTPLDPAAVTLTAVATVGVQGLALDEDGVGGLFVNARGGLGAYVVGDLKVDGKLLLRDGGGGGGGAAVKNGGGVIPANVMFHDVVDAAVQPQSFVAVTFTQNPFRGAVHYIEPHAGFFRIRLRPMVFRPTAFTYVVVG
jgi:hypothetical protein